MARIDWNRFDALSGIFVAGTLAVSAFAYPSLPDPMPIHFGIDGTADGFSSRAFGAFFVPCVAGAVALGVRFATSKFPVGKIEPNGRAIGIVMAATTAFLCSLHVAILSSAREGHLRGSFMPLALGAFSWILSAIMPRVRRNGLVGVRTPWSLASDENWGKTHRVASYTMAAGGLVDFLATALPGALGFQVAIVAFLVGALSPAVYSMSLARNA